MQIANDPETLQLRLLVQRAQQGDVSALPELREALDACPELWRQVGDLAAQTQAAWLDLIGGQDLLLRECLMRQLAEMRVELVGPAPCKIEELLIERILAAWLMVQFADTTAAQACNPGTNAATRESTLKQQAAAGRRFTAAIKQLALVRKLLPPRQTASQPEAAIVPSGVRWPAPAPRGLAI